VTIICYVASDIKYVLPSEPEYIFMSHGWKNHSLDTFYLTYTF
jgi:hypothetical protein